MTKGTGFRAALAAVFSLYVFGSAPAQAQDVILRSNDGTVEVRGRLVEFSDGFYVLENILGRQRLSAERLVCVGEACPKPDEAEADLVFAGSSTMGQGMMPLLILGYASQLGAEADIRNGSTPNSVIAELVADGGFGNLLETFLVKSSISDDAFSALLEKRANIGLSSRRILRTEARELRESGAGNMVDVRQERIVAVDPMTIIVNPSNPVTQIRELELSAIYQGLIRNWSELGGPDLPITLYTYDAGTTSRLYFDELALTGAPMSTAAKIITDDNAMAAAVNADPGGIGYVGYAFQRGAKPLSLLLNCGIAALPTPFASKTEQYPLHRRLYMYARADGMTETVQQFLDFATSPAADGVIAKSGFVDLGIERQTGELPDEMVRSMLNSAIDTYELTFAQKMVEERRKWNRLSATFRFATGSSRLDERGLADLRRLAEYLALEPAGTRVAVVGFTDSDGPFDANLNLAIQRARQVAAELDALAGPSLGKLKFEAQGYGELAPEACNDTQSQKRINRRVEIWIRPPDA
ncbi:MAG TPA: phosphate ABC transporter substrate-binding/OmpA family protein [Thermohalobaculum sp.]|nr:phosphate ABC transporter substrate-binding/OmpA family protein [Thermohalobaculum sp.]